MNNTPDAAIRPECFVVLVVEDEFLIAMDLEMMLIEGGHTVMGPVGTVKGALRLLEEERPDVALLDLNLQNVVASPVAERLHSLQIPFVIASANAPEDFPVCTALDGVENIGKPFTGRSLLAAIDRAVNPAARPGTFFADEG